ncbi:MAG: hypothetical protein AAFQ37_03670, partial [Bacteroidota bacterium]
MPRQFPSLTIDVSLPFKELMHEKKFHQAVAHVLPSYLPHQRWFTSKGKSMVSCTIRQSYNINDYTGILLCAIDFVDGTREHYQLPIAWNTEPEWLDFFLQFNDRYIIAQVGEPAEIILSDAVPRANFRKELYLSIKEGRTPENGLTADRGKVLTNEGKEVASHLPNIDSSNTAIIYN